jgi:Fe-S-cluster-containing hydrogenase component 2
MNPSPYFVIDSSALQVLFKALQQRNYDLIGPTLCDNAVVYDRVVNVEDLPKGWGDEQDAGIYRLRKRNGDAIFGFNLGPHSWKKFLFPPALKLFTSIRSKDGVVLIDGGSNGTAVASDASIESQPKPLAFIGVRACELHAIFIQDKVFTGSMYTDPHYALLREQAFIVAVNCTQAAATCFCASMKTGPRVDHGFDLCLTEIIKGNLHYFVVKVGSEKGQEIMKNLPHRDAAEGDIEEATHLVEQTAASLKRSMDTKDVKSLLQQNLEHSRWQVVAERCLSCANCTMVCPTCFCHTVEDTTDLSGSNAERWRKWDSCFTIEFSYIHGGSIRTSPKSRYRQWLSHKLANWIDQFGTSGCVGCGRCITWCPVGIDLTEEVHALRESAPARLTSKSTSATISKSEVNHHGVS